MAQFNAFCTYVPSRLVTHVLTGCVALVMGPLVGCTKKAETGTVKITMPSNLTTSTTKSSSTASAYKDGVVTAAASTGPAWNTSLNPATGSEINCFAVFVGGTDLTANSCSVGASSASTTSTIKFGPNVGFVPSGSTISVPVPSGDRVIYVVGLRSGVATACSDFAGKEPDATNLSEPFLIASQAVKIAPGDNNVSVAAALDTSKKILDCTFITGGGGGGSNALAFGDKRDGSLTQPTGSVLWVGGSSTLTSAGVTRSGVSPLGSTKTFAAVRKVSGIATTGTSAGSQLTLASTFTADDFEVGDEVAWYVAGGNSSIGSPDDPTNGACGGGLYIGRFGTARITATASSTGLVLNQPISGSPATIRTANLAASAGTTDYCHILVTRVSSFDAINVGTSATFTLKPATFAYGSATGGLLVVRADTVTVAAGGTLNLDATSLGFAGGLASASIYQGDGINSAGLASTNPNYNGGGAGTLSTAGGGGGALGGLGSLGIGSVPSNGGTTPNHCMSGGPCYPLNEYKVFMGGGGGGAGSSATGGSGGGVVILFARKLLGTGTVSLLSNGGNGATGSAGSGGGAGGSVSLFNQESSVTTLMMKALGGNGGTGTFTGGGGGGGLVHMRRCLSKFTTAAPTLQATLGTGGSGGSNGLTNIEDDPSICLIP